ncbi:hypothetical protein HanIR_Chr06g0271611 [Helianthus annuus]|nr:hypothetical protein HanIR_Chr06g0271611 [Helianthus annuus]
MTFPFSPVVILLTSVHAHVCIGKWEQKRDREIFSWRFHVSRTEWETSHASTDQGGED